MSNPAIAATESTSLQSVNVTNLRNLAARVVVDYWAGRGIVARALLRFENLAPPEISYVTDCMHRVGLSEPEINGLFH